MEPRTLRMVLLLLPLLLLSDAVKAFVVERRARQSTLLSRSNNNRRTTQTIESLVVCLQAEKKENAEQDEDDGWGFDVDDQLVAQAEKEMKSEAAATNAAADQERDLFIPLVALISIIGFGGLYGYEMLRLYFAGELYLPFLH